MQTNLKGGNMYSPKISPSLIPLIYKKAKEQKKPMTKIVNEIISSWFLAKNIQQSNQNDHGKISKG